MFFDDEKNEIPFSIEIMSKNNVIFFVHARDRHCRHPPKLFMIVIIYLSNILLSFLLNTLRSLKY